MNEEKPINHYDLYQNYEQVKPEYSNTHIVSHSNRDIFITLGNAFPPDNKIKVVARVILNPVTAQELALNIQKQLQKLKEETEYPKR